MSGNAFVTIVVAAMALTSVVLLVIALRSGRRSPLRTWPWVVALVLTVIPAVFITIVAVVTVAHEVSWLLLGALGLWAMIALTVFRPRWAAWTYLGSGIAFPIVLMIGELALPDDQMMIEPANALVYLVRIIVPAALLIWATQPRHVHTPSPELVR